MHSSSYAAFCQNKVLKITQWRLDWLTLLLLAFGELTASDTYSIEYEEYEDKEDLIKLFEEEPVAGLETPDFVSQRVDLVVTEEETIRLPCLLERQMQILTLQYR